MRAHPCLAAFLVIFLAGVGAGARADEVATDVLAADDPPRDTGAELPFVFVTDPTTPAAGTIEIGYGVGQASAGAAHRPIPPEPTAGMVHAATLAFGVTSRFAPFAAIEVRPDASGDRGASVGASLGASMQLTDPGAAFRFTLIAHGFREVSGDLGAAIRAAASYDLGRVRLAGNVHLERAFADGRDEVDVLVMTGVSVRVRGALRLGAEYVGQDLEAAIEDDEAEGGARHYLGPNLALDVRRSGTRIQLAAGPAVSLTAPRGELLARLALRVSF